MTRRSPATGLGSGLRVIGPGLVLAATGVGAGDLVAAAVSGSRFGFAVVWAAAVGAAIKFAMNEGLARWQLATGTTLLEGWALHFGRGVQYLFLGYLVIWSFVVAGALFSACGLAAHSLAPGLSVYQWGAVHSIVAATLVLVGGYRSFEKVIGVFVGVMFLSLIGCALISGPPIQSGWAVLREASVPPGSGPALLGVIGGVGGSVTLLSYGYWIREKGWEGASALRIVRLDLIVAYTLTGIFGVAVMVLAARILFASGLVIEGNEAAATMARMLGEVVGPAGVWAFKIGFWGAVTTSMLGVWQGVPYLFADFVGLIRDPPNGEPRPAIETRSPWYRGFLGWLALSPLIPIFSERPVQMIVTYAILSALFMPFLAGTLLVLNRRAVVGEGLRNRWPEIATLSAGLGLFGYLAVRKLSELIFGG